MPKWSRREFMTAAAGMSGSLASGALGCRPSDNTNEGVYSGRFTYRCGEDIPAKRLEIDPATMRCVDCAG